MNYNLLMRRREFEYTIWRIGEKEAYLRAKQGFGHEVSKIISISTPPTRKEVLRQRYPKRYCCFVCKSTNKKMVLCESCLQWSCCKCSGFDGCDICDTKHLSKAIIYGFDQICAGLAGSGLCNDLLIEVFEWFCENHSCLTLHDIFPPIDTLHLVADIRMSKYDENMQSYYDNSYLDLD